MKTLVICHEGDRLNEFGLVRWLGSFSDVCGVVVIHENRQRILKRIKREIERVGLIRFADVLAFRLYYRLVHAKRDQRWEDRCLAAIYRTYGEAFDSVPVLHTSSPNSQTVADFIRNAAPDIMIARCKTILKPQIFKTPSRGTFVLHPGICPEYRNAHGCFWALANGDYDRVGMTLLQVNEGVDTGAVYGYYSSDLDEVAESHIVIQHRVVFDNLDAIRKKLEDIYFGRAQTIDTSGRASGVWGQPWLSRYLQWKRSARKRHPAFTNFSRT